jgi:hypothetical protein
MNAKPHQATQEAAQGPFKLRPLSPRARSPKAAGNPRNRRLIELLLSADGGMVSRHAIADDVGCVNVADLVRRVKAGGVSIESGEREHTDRDGRRSRIGLYGLTTDEARAKAKQVLALLAGEA